MASLVLVIEVFTHFSVYYSYGILKSMFLTTLDFNCLHATLKVPLCKTVKTVTLYCWTGQCSQQLESLYSIHMFSMIRTPLDGIASIRYRRVHTFWYLLLLWHIRIALYDNCKFNQLPATLKVPICTTVKTFGSFSYRIPLF